MVDNNKIVVITTIIILLLLIIINLSKRLHRTWTKRRDIYKYIYPGEIYTVHIIIIISDVMLHYEQPFREGIPYAGVRHVVSKKSNNYCNQT